MSEGKLILVVESDPRAGRELKFALESRGHNVRLTGSNVVALESCVHKPPDLLIVSDDKPVIDGLTLVNILHSNPNTSETLIIFLTPDPGGLTGIDGFQEAILRKPCPAEEVVAASEKILSRSERVARMSGEPEHLAQGDLGDRSLPEVLQALHRARRTGTLFLERPGARRGEGQAFIYLKDGEAINALLGRFDGEKAFFRILPCNQGRFELMPDQAVTELHIRRPLGELLAEGARQIEALERLRAVLPGPGAHLRLQGKLASLPPGVHPVMQEVLLLLEYHSRLEDVVDNCSAPDFRVLQTLHKLIERGLVKVDPGTVEPEPAHYSWASAPHLNHLREKLAPRGLPPSGKTSGRILVFSPDAGLGAVLLESLSELPGFTLPGNRAAGTGADASRRSAPFPVIAEWKVADDITLRLLDTPIDELHRPLWSYLSRGAVGALCLLNGTREDWVDALKPVSDFFQATYAIPIGYLILGEEPVQMELKAKLVSTFTLKGDNALFMLPGRQPEKLRVILKRLIEQIVSR